MNGDEFVGFELICKRSAAYDSSNLPLGVFNYFTIEAEGINWGHGDGDWNYYGAGFQKH
jgi:hypothetical protein